MSRPMYFPPAPFDLNEALRCTHLVETAYDMYAQWKAQGKPKADVFQWSPKCRLALGFSNPIWGEDPKLLWLDREEPFAFVAWSADGGVYLVFRGTESAEDWVVDASAELTDYALVAGYGRVHEGFYRVYASMSKAVHAALALALGKVERPEALFITGHSLGSSLSTLSVPDVLTQTGIDRKGMRVKHYNLASPRTGDMAFASAYNTNGVVTYRVVNTTDAVPEVPPSILGHEIFEHIGSAVTFSAQYGSLGGNHSASDAYGYALKHPEAPQGPVSA